LTKLTAKSLLIKKNH